MILIYYCIAYAFCVLLTAPFFSFQFNSSTYTKQRVEPEYVETTIFGLLVGLLWPVTLPVFLLVLINKRIWLTIRRRARESYERQQNGTGINVGTGGEQKRAGVR